MHQSAQTFAGQISADVYISDIYYILGAVACFLVVVAIALIDGGLVNPKHLIDTLVQTLLSALIAGAALLLGGYALWMWQYNVAFGISHPLRQAFSDWWLFGHYMTTYPQFIDPASAPDIEGQQIFVVFFFGYAAIFGAFVHSMGLGRIKPSVSYILSAAAGGVMMPVLTYLTWGSASFLTNNGMHDYVGAYSLYMFVGIWSTILAWRLGPRLTSTNGFKSSHVRLRHPAPDAGYPALRHRLRLRDARVRLHRHQWNDVGHWDRSMQHLCGFRRRRHVRRGHSISHA